MTLEEARAKWKSMEGGANKVVWGNETCRRILGEKHNVIWLIAQPSLSVHGTYDFCRADQGVVGTGTDRKAPNERTRYAMLCADDNHYQAIVHKGEHGERGSFTMADMPQIVKEIWNLSVL